MENQGLKVFKILYSGEIEEINRNNLLDLFSLLNVIGFYSLRKKKLYIWVGSFASRTIKNYIVKFRQIFKTDYPQYSVLRYITIESKSETHEFFENTGISKKALDKRISLEEEKYEKHDLIINQIKELKDEADTYFEKEQFEQAISMAKKIIEKAKEIDEKSLIRDQIEFISESEARAKAKLVLKDIREEKKKIKNLYENLQKNSEIINLHGMASRFEKKYLDYLDLTALSDVKTLLNSIKYSYKKFEEEYKKSNNSDEILNEIEILRNKAKTALNRREFRESINLFREILIILNKQE